MFALPRLIFPDQRNILLISTCTNDHPPMKLGNKIFHFLCEAWGVPFTSRIDVNAFTVYENEQHLRLIDNSLLEFGIQADSELSIENILKSLPSLLDEKPLQLHYVFLAVNADVYQNSFKAAERVKQCARALCDFSNSNPTIRVLALITSLEDKPISAGLVNNIKYNLQLGGLVNRKIITANDDQDISEVIQMGVEFKLIEENGFRKRLR